MDALCQKYNVPAPRYTSYPTVPYWVENNPEEKVWLSHVKREFENSNAKAGISLYIHLPFCESLCTYCGCNKRITKNHGVEAKYIEALLREWSIYKTTFNDKPIISELHLGGGTPTFFSPENLENLLMRLFKGAEIPEKHDFSFEGHPNNTTREHLDTLAALGFRRVSFGIQDFDLKVQIAIHRLQPLVNVRRAFDDAKRAGYTSINFDLVYGLPMQTVDSFSKTVDKIKDFMPDRIALYSYAHVPWKSPSQRGYSEEDLPAPEIKKAMYDNARQSLTNMGYHEIGMDHFALPHDDLFKAQEASRLNRNFMGYTTSQSQLLVGLGCSSISSSGTAYVQNEKKVEDYLAATSRGTLGLIRGHYLTDEDMKRQSLIKNLICRGVASIDQDILEGLPAPAWESLLEMQEEGLLYLDSSELNVTPLGMNYIRNICMLFDAYLYKGQEKYGQFSQAV